LPPLSMLALLLTSSILSLMISLLLQAIDVIKVGGIALLCCWTLLPTTRAQKLLLHVMSPWGPWFFCAAVVVVEILAQKWWGSYFIETEVVLTCFVAAMATFLVNPLRLPLPRTWLPFRDPKMSLPPLLDYV
jgi:hypothetical protein